MTVGVLAKITSNVQVLQNIMTILMGFCKSHYPSVEKVVGQFFTCP